VPDKLATALLNLPASVFFLQQLSSGEGGQYAACSVDTKEAIMAKIILDPGHGGTTKIGGSSANNAIGPTGLLEKTVTLDLALRSRDLLADRGHTVVLTRKDDQNLGLADRANVAKTRAAPVFLSIHLNGLNKSVQGTETFCHTVHGSVSADFCRALQKRVVAATGHSDRNAGHPGGVKRASLGVLKPSLHHPKTACCLLEVSFMDVPAEEARLKTAAYLNKLAKAIADGISDYVANSRIESVAGAAMLEDGFALGGGETIPLSNIEAPARRKSPAKKKPGKKKAAKKKASKKAAKKPRYDDQNDVNEFSHVDIGEGFDADAYALETVGSRLEAIGFNLDTFRSYIQSLGLRYFSAEELLYMGGSNAPGEACAGKNRPPGENLWTNIGNTARMLDEIRHRLNAKCTILSAYRSPAYNSCVGGENASLHMKYNAIDFRCVSGTPSQWHTVATAARASAAHFKGGIGKYSSFIHIDTRGHNANW
jgi:N-acetylmuramoyl-L-alanine amidase